MSESKKEFWSILRADEIQDFLELVDLAGRILKKRIADIEILAGGLTNKSFKLIMEDGQLVVMRLAGRGTGEYINRSAEKNNSTKVAGLGIAPEIYYFDAETGSQLVEFVKMPTMHIEDFQTNTTVITEAGKLLRRLHDSGAKFIGAFDPVKGIIDYVKILEQKGFAERFEGWDKIYPVVQRVDAAYKKNPPPQGPCHNDVLAENFMYDGKTMMLIDWEYGGVGDPYYDVSGAITENLMDKNATETWLKAYFGGEPTEEQRARVDVNKFLYCTYWSVWSLVQIANGKEREFYWEYGLHRAKLGLEYMADPNFDKYVALLGG